MVWPTAQDYNEAVQNPATCFSDRELRGGEIELTTLGLPRPASGAFASVYKIRCGDLTFAVRCFLSEILDQEQRYEHLSRFIMSDELPYTVSFEYQRQGMRVHGNWYPILKMDWVEGETLMNSISANLNYPQKLLELAEQFRTMVKDLQMNGVAHGDLQHGNIVLQNGELRLIDYDGMFVPSLFGIASNELGHRNYQHPMRDALHFGPYLDNFSAWLIYLSLQILAIDSGLWQELQAGDESLLLKKTDFIAPDRSERLGLLLHHENEQIRSMAKTLLQIISMNVEEVPALDATEFSSDSGGLRMPSTVERMRWNFSRWWKKSIQKRFGAAPEIYDPPEQVTPLRKAPLPEQQWWLVKNSAEMKRNENRASLILQLGKGAKTESTRQKSRRMLKQARLYVSNYQFDEAHKVYDKLKLVLVDANKRTKIEALEERIQAYGQEGDYYFSRSKVVGAAMAYEHAVQLMKHLRVLKDNAAILSDDILLLRVLWSLADAYERCGRIEKVKDTLHMFVQVCGRHRETHGRKFRAQERLLDAMRSK